jgi:hypothetical protein
MTALAIQHGGKISSPNGHSLCIKGEVGKGVAADFCIGTAGPSAIGIFSEILAFYFASERCFSLALLSRICRVEVCGHRTIRRNMARRRAQFDEHREIDRSISLDSLAILEETMRHFYFKARVLEGLGEEGDYDLLDKAWGEAGKWAEKVAQFHHAKVQSIRLAGDPNAPVLPEHMTFDQLRESIIVDLERLRETGVLDLPQLTQGVVDKS